MSKRNEPFIIIIIMICLIGGITLNDCSAGIGAAKNFVGEEISKVK